MGAGGLRFGRLYGVVCVAHTTDPFTQADLAPEQVPPFRELGVAFYVPELAECVPFVAVLRTSFTILPLDADPTAASTLRAANKL